MKRLVVTERATVLGGECFLGDDWRSTAPGASENSRQIMRVRAELYFFIVFRFLPT